MKVRYRELEKNTAQLKTLFMLSNLWLVRHECAKMQDTGHFSVPCRRLMPVWQPDWLGSCSTRAFVAAFTSPTCS